MRLRSSLLGPAAVAAFAFGTAATACDERPPLRPDTTAVGEQVDELKDRVERFSRENSRRITRHRPDTGLEVPTAETEDAEGER